MSKNIYGDDINYDELEQHVYPDEGPEIFYICPICGNEYLKNFITQYDGRTMCIDCWSERNEDQLMSNLGSYLWITKAAKKVGGPINLVLLIGASGAALYKGSELIVKKCIKTVQKNKKQKPSTTRSEILYKVILARKSNEGLDFAVGDQFRVLESDGDAVLIEKIGDTNNPYFVSAKLLHKISNYKG